MPRILIDKRDNSVVDDFQGSPSPGTLMGNAIRAGLGVEADFNEVDITQEEYDQHVADKKERTRVAREALVAKNAANFRSANGKLKGLGFTKDEIKALFPHLQ